MNKSARFISGLLTATLMLAASTVNQALAVEPGAKSRPTGTPTKVLFENDKVRVQEVTFRPGDQGPNVPRPFRIIRVLEGGTIQRTYPDGKNENVDYRPGEVKVYKADKPFVPKNVGKSTIVFYVVALKEPTK